MAKSVLLRVLQDYFGRYIDGLSSENLKVAVWQGEVNLENLDLKREILDTASLYVPLQFKCGRIRKFHVSVPWSQLGSQPVKVLIDGLHLLAQITADDDHFTAEKEVQEDGDLANGRQSKRLSSAMRKIVAEKRFKLRWAELLGEDSAEIDQDPQAESFLTRLGSKIMENLQVTIRSAHIRFEDAGFTAKDTQDAMRHQDLAGRPAADGAEELCLGMTVGEVCMQSCDADGVIRFIDEKPGALSYKIFKIDRLAFYVDACAPMRAGQNVDAVVEEMSRLEQLISDTTGRLNAAEIPGRPLLVLEPCLITLLMCKNDAPGGSEHPRYSFTLSMNTMDVVLRKRQYMWLYNLYKAVQRHWLFAEFRQHRPADRVAANPKAWWRYAMQCLRMKREKERALESLEEYRKQQLRDWKVLVPLVVDQWRYLHLFKLKHGKQSRFTESHAKELQDLEDKLEVDHTLHFRSLALAELSLEQRRMREEASWLSSWFAADDVRLSDADREELLDVMDLNFKAGRGARPIPIGSIYSRLVVSIGRGRVCLKEEDRVIGQLDIGGEQRVEWLAGRSWRLSAGLKRFLVTYGEEGRERWPIICDFSGRSPLLELVRKEVGLASNREEQWAVWASAEFKNDEDISRQLLRVTLNTMPCVVTVVPAFFAEVTDFFSLKVLKQSAAGALGKMSHSAVADVKEKRRLHVDLEIAAPVVAFPVLSENSRSKEPAQQEPVKIEPVKIEPVNIEPAQVLVLDFGLLTARREDLDSVLTRSRSMDTDEEGDVFYSAVEEREIYSHEWFLKVSSMQMLLCQLSGSVDGMEQGRAEEILHKFDLNLHVERTKTASQSLLVMAFTLDHMRWIFLPRLLRCLHALSHQVQISIAQEQIQEDFNVATPSPSALTLRASFIIGQVDVGLLQDDCICIASTQLQGIEGSVEANAAMSDFQTQLSSILVEDTEQEDRKELARSISHSGEPLIKVRVRQDAKERSCHLEFNSLHLEWRHRAFNAIATHYYLPTATPRPAISSSSSLYTTEAYLRRSTFSARLGSFSIALNLLDDAGCAGILSVRDLEVNVEEEGGRSETKGELGNLSLVKDGVELFTVASKTDALIEFRIEHGPIYRLNLRPSRLLYVQPVFNDLFLFIASLDLSFSTATPARDIETTSSPSFSIAIDMLEVRLPTSCDPLDSSFVALRCRQFEAESFPTAGHAVVMTAVSMEDLDVATSDDERGRQSLLESSVRFDISLEQGRSDIDYVALCRVSDVCVRVEDRQYWQIISMLTNNLMESPSWSAATSAPPQAHSTFDVKVTYGLASLSLVEKGQGLAVFAMRRCSVSVIRPALDAASTLVLNVKRLTLYDRRAKSAEHWFQHLIITEPGRHDADDAAFELRFNHLERHVEIDLIGFTSVVLWTLLTNIVAFVTTVQDPQEEQALLAGRRWAIKREAPEAEAEAEAERPAQWTGAFRLIQPRLYFVQDFGERASNMVVFSGDIELGWKSDGIRAVWNGKVSQLQAYVASSWVKDRQRDILESMESGCTLIQESVQHQLMEPTQFSFEYESAYVDMFNLVQSDRVEMRLTQCELYFSLNDLILIAHVLRTFESEAEPQPTHSAPPLLCATMDSVSTDGRPASRSSITLDDADTLAFTVWEGAAGIRLRSEHGFLVVDVVEQDSAAELCGVMVGDVLMMVDGAVVVESSVAQVEAELAAAKRPVRVSVQKQSSLLPVVFKRTVSLKCSKIVVNFVDDLDDGDLPLSNFVLSDMDAFVNGSSVGTFVGGFLVNVTAAHYFDHTLGSWGMLMTPATLNLTTTWYHSNDLDLQVDMPDPIQFFLSERFLRVLYTAASSISVGKISMTARIPNNAKPPSLSSTPLNYAHVVHNFTGYTIRFAKPNSPSVELPDGQSAVFGVPYHSGAGIGKVRGYSHRCTLRIELVARDDSIFIGEEEINASQTGEGVLQLCRASDNAKLQSKYEIYIEEGSRRLAVRLRSLIQIRNKLEYPLAVLANGVGWGSAKLSPNLINPGKVDHLPLWFNDLSEVRVRPVLGTAASNFEWSTPCFKSMAQVTEEGQENTCPLSCASLHGPARFFNCIILMQEDGVTVAFSFLPSLTLHNMLPVPLLFQESAPKVSDAMPIAMGAIEPGNQQQLTRLSLSSANPSLLTFSVQGSEWTRRISLTAPKRRKRKGKDGDGPSDRDEHVASFKLQMNSGQSVRCEMVYTREEAGVTKAVVYVQYWVLNRTHLPIHIQADFIKVPNAALYMYSPTEKTKSRLRFNLVEPMGEGAEPVEIGTPGLSQKARVETQEKIYDVGVSVDVAPGALYRTSVVTIAPLYVVVNDSSWTVNIRQALAKDHISAFEPGTSRPYWSAPVSMPHPYEIQLSFSFASDEGTVSTEWSKPFVVDDYTRAEGTVHIALKRLLPGSEGPMMEYFAMEAHASNEAYSTLIKLCDSSSEHSFFLSNIKRFRKQRHALTHAHPHRAASIKIASISLDISQDAARAHSDPQPLARFFVSGMECEVSASAVAFRCARVHVGDLRPHPAFREVLKLDSTEKQKGVELKVERREVDQSLVQLFDLLELTVLPVTLNVDEAFVADFFQMYQRITFVDVLKRRRRAASRVGQLKEVGQSSARSLAQEKEAAAAVAETIQGFIGFSQSASLVNALELGSDHQPLYFDRLCISSVKVVVSLQQDPTRDEASRLYDLGGGWLSRMNIRVDGAVLSFEQLASEGLFGSRNMFLSKAKLHYVDQVKAQMTSFYTKVNPWATNWGIAATVQGRIYGAKVDSSEFPGRRMRMSEMVNEYKQRVQSCVSVENAVTTLRQLVFDWRFNHRGINAQRCVVLGVINLSTMDIDVRKPVLKSQNRLGSKLHHLSSGSLALTRFDGKLSRGNMVALMACGSRLKEAVKIEFLCGAFYGLFGAEDVLQPSEESSVNYIHKRRDEWHALYMLVINEKIK